ncbi:HPr-rel-A system PqqD family peptide chaperone [uncultured Sphingomonas sp.]|uniref:HPr-rel-A system PqqD family peptide chaperone n=1 Tax=uncultured Sphingomonas sp. TaxID=158754 RepID=UPI00262A7F6F|nr:HPr-rel-A system PqqD family peptide chaperone [uncultured Sphingomonas sp.]
MAATRYRAPAPDGLRIAPLDDLTAIYQRASGITHIVIAPVPELLEAMAGEWRTLDALADAFGLAADERAALTERLDELVGAGLIEAG